MWLSISPTKAQEKAQNDIEFGVTAYGIYNSATNGSAHDGKVFAPDDGIAQYPGWSGSGGGFGLGLSAMWRGYVGLDLQVLYTTHQLSGTFDDSGGDQFAFDYTLAQFDVPIMLKAAWPNSYVTPSISVGKVWRKGDTVEGELTGGVADVRRAFGFSEKHWLTRFGGGLETALPLKSHDLRISLNVMVNYDSKIADGLKGDEIDTFCSEYDEGGETIRSCVFDPEFGTVWRTDVMLGLGYYF